MSFLIHIISAQPLRTTVKYPATQIKVMNSIAPVGYLKSSFEEREDKCGVYTIPVLGPKSEALNILPIVGVLAAIGKARPSFGSLKDNVIKVKRFDAYTVSLTSDILRDYYDAKDRHKGAQTLAKDR